MRANFSLPVREPSTPRRVVLAFVATWVVLLLGVSAARADDLLILGGDSITLSGSHQYGFVYVDGDMRLTGDTSISASSIYIGPNAYVATCYVPGVGDNGCTSGRSLVLSSTGKLIVSSRIDLTGGTGSPRSGGSLSLSGNPVTVGGDIATAGENGGNSGTVTIASGGALSTGGIYAPSAPVNLTAGGSIDVAGDIDTYGTSATSQPDPSRVQSAAPVTINSSGGDVRIAGNVNAGGRDAPAAGGLSGGNGAPVSIAGSTVRTGAIDVTGGGSAAASGGAPSTISISARSALHALGRLDASGSGSVTGDATPGNRITLSAGGRLTAAGGVHVDGATGPTGGSVAGVISLTGAGITSGDLTAVGGNAPNGPTPPPAGRGGSISVSSSADALLGGVLAPGGNSYNGGTAGHGGRVSVTAEPGPIATSDVQANGGYTSNGPGSDGGPIALSTAGDLTVGGMLDATGSDANGSFDPPLGGGSGGNVVLRAAGGTLSLGGGAYAGGGRGSGNPTSGQLGGTGGQGGRIDVIARALGPITAISSAGGPGGNYGADQGPGGAGGPIFAWTDAALFDSQKVVDSDGGDGNPTGQAGPQRPNSSPTGLQQLGGALSFTSQSPDAQGYRLLASVTGGPAQAALQTTATSGLRPSVPMCVPVTFAVVAYNASVGWTSNPSPPVAYVRQPSARQNCPDAPRLTATQTVHQSLKRLRRAAWKAKIPITTTGIGKLDLSFVAVTVVTTKQRGKHGHKKTRTTRRKLFTWSTRLARAGRVTLRVRLPKSARHDGTYVLSLVTTSPDGKHHATKNLTLEIGP
jgi:hypothetical protein